MFIDLLSVKTCTMQFRLDATQSRQFIMYHCACIVSDTTVYREAPRARSPFQPTLKLPAYMLKLVKLRIKAAELSSAAQGQQNAAIPILHLDVLSVFLFPVPSQLPRTERYDLLHFPTGDPKNGRRKERGTGRARKGRPRPEWQDDKMDATRVRHPKSAETRHADVLSSRKSPVV